MSALNYSETSLEKIPVTVFPDDTTGSQVVATEIADIIKEKQQEGKPAVLGLATGASPLNIYKELIRMHKEEGLSFSNVITFNLDEYYPMEPDSLQSYVRFMYENLFNHIDIKKENIHIPDGTLSLDAVKTYCREYDEQIEKLGGLDLQLLGIGRTGHIGFNEPGSSLSSPTRMVKLDPLTVSDAAKDFIKEEFVPLRAITMGVGTIMQAKKIILVAWGQGKAPIVQEMVEGKITDEVPASFLQTHPNASVVLDERAAANLARYKTPWVVSLVDWDKKMTRRAVTWLSQKINKPILKLTDEDYKEAGLMDLLVQSGSAYDLNIQVFAEIQKTITGWPGGKPESDDKNRPERSTPAIKRSIIFSPHPDDDVISMGGTLLRLVDQGHDVHVAYQTSGNIAVFDDDAYRFASFAKEFMDSMGIKSDFPEKFEDLKQFLAEKKLGEQDQPLVKSIKGLIRKGEAEAGCRFCGVKEQNVHFLNLPFYETGQVKKKPIGEADIKIIVDLLQEVKPHQIFAAGDLQDPHGTHAVCLDAIFKALAQLKEQGEAWLEDCYVWLYRGAWQEWDIEDIEMAIPISPEQLMRKRKAIFKHQSQKDSPVFPGNDKREFWQRAEDRNRTTAQLYDKLGLTEYEAMEAFVRYHF
ncbi:glucosamine-6-phosphate deaminase [Fulvivirga sediminis]|uniref:Glucosamine-6-phosphate deaminase n=1 Tax=Fulvivirga sediminis TaxID=2803949 RepID=A0A937F7U4_9BACT|nr:glucosamine-6-phosphate deaminase [Fulvivirga sediminis]MBL3655879.1 glucosamine-6-phosphate deaminase [Fulvivirga sediminis]